jgi:hypothetical protein
MKPLSRRSVTAGLAAAVTAIPALGLAKGSNGAPELRALIEVHRAAFRAFGQAIDREGQQEEAFEQSQVVVHCPMAGEAYDISAGREFCEERLAAAYGKQRDRLAPLAKVAPDLAKQARAAIDAAEEDNRLVLERLLAEEDTRKEASGFAEAERQYTAAEQAERDAAMALCDYRCQTIEEARIKAKYLATVPLIKDFANEELMALLGSFAT